jgi:hypothetical protein
MKSADNLFDKHRNGFPDRVVIDKSGANLVGLQNMNCLLILNGWFWPIRIPAIRSSRWITAPSQFHEPVNRQNLRQNLLYNPFWLEELPHFPSPI